MIKKILTLLNNTPDEIIETRYLAEDNFPFLLQTEYNKVISDFKKRFIYKKRINYKEIRKENNIFTEPASQIDLQVFDFTIADYAIPQLSERYNVSISLHNRAIARTPNQNPYRIMVKAINIIGQYILENKIPCFLPYYEFDFSTRLPKQLIIPKGLEIFFQNTVQ